jgi:hypothetical protein
MRDEIENLEFYKFLPSPFGRGAGGEGMNKEHNQRKNIYFNKTPSP